MDNLDKYLNKAREMAEDAGGKAKNAAGDVLGAAREKLQGVLQDNRAGKEIRQGIAELEALPEIDGSILYTMELQSAGSYLRNLLLIINDGRLDSASVAEELSRVMDRVQPADDTQEEETEEQQAIANVKNIVYSACARALEALNA